MLREARRRVTVPVPAGRWRRRVGLCVLLALVLVVAMTTSSGAHAGSNIEYPFGAMSVAADGTLYYVDREYGQIDEATAHGPRVVLSSLHGGTARGRSIAGLSGLSAAGNSLWFTAAGALYRTTLGGGEPRRVGAAPGAVNLDVLDDGTVLYTTSGARSTSAGVFELVDDRPAVRIAGGGILASAQQLAAEHPANALGDLAPVDVVSQSADTFYFVNDNNLYLVQDGQAMTLRPLGDFFNGELAASPNGVLYGVCGWRICRIRGRTFTPLFRLTTRIGGTFVAPDAIAVSPTGSFYLAYSSQSEPTAHTGIVELSASGKLARIVVSRTTDTT